MAKEIICLDTSILIDYYRKQNKSITKFVELSRTNNFAVSVITKLEILTGINNNQTYFWESVFNSLTILPIGEPEVEIASGIIRSLRKNNKIIELPDILIASTALANNLKLATLNTKHFERIKNLEIIG